MTVKGDWDEFAVLAMFCRICIRAGMSGREAIQRFRDNGGHITTKTFYEVWTDQKMRILR